MNSRKKNVLIIDGFSTGRFLVDEWRKRGYNPYHLLIFDDSIPINEYSKNEQLYYMSKIKVINYTKYEKNFKLPDYKNYDELLVELKKYNFIAVMPGTEDAVSLSEKISYSFRLPTNDLSLSDTRRNKYEMQKRLKTVGLNYIPYILSSNFDEIISFYEKNKYKKIVIKEILGAASENVYICNNKNEINKAFNKIINTIDMYGNKNKKVLAQKFIKGEEIVINAAVKNGKKNIVGLYKYRKEELDGAPVYDSTELITKITKKHREAFNYVYDCLDALGIKNAITHSELKIDSDTGKPILIETAARLSGIVNNSPYYSKKALGFLEYEKAVDIFIDNKELKKEEYKPDPNKHLMYKALITYSNSKQHIDHSKVYNYLNNIEGVVWVNLVKYINNLEKTVTLDDTLGFVCIYSNDIEVYKNAYKKVREFEKNNFLTN